jgi:hypothetical protein
VWAWQAKYLFEFDSSAAGQVTSSVKRALDLEPKLKRYFVAFPIDLPGGDTEERQSAHTRWTEKVSEWKEIARRKGMAVEFVHATRTIKNTTFAASNKHDQPLTRRWIEAKQQAAVTESRTIGQRRKYVFVGELTV